MKLYLITIYWIISDASLRTNLATSPRPLLLLYALRHLYPRVPTFVQRELMRQVVQKEVQLLKRCGHHPNIVSLVAAQRVSARQACIVLEYCEGNVAVAFRPP